MWGDSRYNVLVKQVEECSDHLQYVVSTVEENAKGDAVAENIIRRMKRLIEALDLQALKMLAPYDIFAKQCLVEKLKRDPRRRRGGAYAIPNKELAAVPANGADGPQAASPAGKER